MFHRTKHNIEQNKNQPFFFFGVMEIGKKDTKKTNKCLMNKRVSLKYAKKIEITNKMFMFINGKY